MSMNKEKPTKQCIDCKQKFRSTLCPKCKGRNFKLLGDRAFQIKQDSHVMGAAYKCLDEVQALLNDPEAMQAVRLLRSKGFCSGYLHALEFCEEHKVINE